MITFHYLKPEVNLYQEIIYIIGLNMKEDIMIENAKNDVPGNAILNMKKSVNNKKSDNFRNIIIKSNDNISSMLEKPKLIRSRNVM
tara:strand:+ start:59 stop:316 length:258 start_codon:yes stop_codon:yes gene_type:complete